MPRIIAVQGITDVVFVPQSAADLDAYLQASPQSMACVDDAGLAATFDESGSAAPAG